MKKRVSSRERNPALKLSDAASAVESQTNILESFEGEIESIDEATGKLSVLIEIFGRQTPYEVEYHEVERP